MAARKVECDVFIAGAGITACTFARVLTDAGLHVVVADAGAQHSLRAGENLKNFQNYQVDVDQFGGIVEGLMHPVSVPVAPGQPFTRHALNPRQRPDRNLPGAKAAYCVGGMAIHWTCAIPRHHPVVELSPLLAPAEWDALYADAERLLGRNVDVHDPSLRQQVLRRVLAGRGVRPTPLAATRVGPEYVRYTGADTVLGPLADEGGRAASTGRFEILREHRVTQLLHKGGGGKVTAALVRDLCTGEDVHVHARAFVVAAGWVHTAQVLWNSGAHRHDGSALGRFLHDHTFTACQVALKQSIVDEVKALAGGGGGAGGAAPDPLGIPMSDPPPHLYIPVSESQLWQGLVFREAFQFDPLTPTVDSRLIVDLKWFGMIDPRPDNRMTFEHDVRDRLGMPQPTFDFQLGGDDARREHEMFLHMQDVAFELGSFLPDTAPGRVPLGASTHTMGATRMGAADDGTSVVDTNSKVWGFDNLYVGGNCVLPDRNACNPTLTTIALALRSARHIAAGGASSSSSSSSGATSPSPTSGGRGA